jgi:hypothetical protein
MSTRRNNGTHYENHQRESELQDAAEHAHRAAIQHGQQEHLTPGELSRQEAEHHQEHSGGAGRFTFGHKEMAALAYEYWEARGCPEGSPDEDWFRATKELRERALAH